MEYEYFNNSLLKKKYQDVVSNLTENKKSDIVFNKENLYHLGGGHDFLRSFFTEYITKSCIICRQFNGYWLIDGKEYKYVNKEFIEVIQESKNLNPINLEDIKFPIIKTAPNLIGDQLMSVKPIQFPDDRS